MYNLLYDNWEECIDDEKLFDLNRLWSMLRLYLKTS